MCAAAWKDTRYGKMATDNHATGAMAPLVKQVSSPARTQFIFGGVMGNWDKSWLRSTFSESDGTGSTIRLCIFIVVLGSVLILGYLAWRKPDTFIACLGLLTAFDTAVCGALYGLNKGSGVAESYFAAKQGDNGSK